MGLSWSSWVLTNAAVAITGALASSSEVARAAAATTMIGTVWRANAVAIQVFIT